MDFARTGIDANVFQDTFAKSSGRENVVRQFAINQGLLNENTSPAFMRHFTENIIPNLASKAEFSGATSMDELNEVVGDTSMNLNHMRNLNQISEGRWDTTGSEESTPIPRLRS